MMTGATEWWRLLFFTGILNSVNKVGELTSPVADAEEQNNTVIPVRGFAGLKSVSSLEARCQSKGLGRRYVDVYADPEQSTRTDTKIRKIKNSMEPPGH
jgi:hypothetical protein